MSKIAVLILAAGYGTRLQKDILADSSGRFEAQKGVSKALLPLAGKPLIGHWLELLKEIEDSIPTEAFIICNASNHSQFLSWAKDSVFPQDRIFNDGTLTNESRLGATTDLSLAISHFSLKNTEKYSAVLVVAGDTLFLKDFSLKEFLTKAALNSATARPPCFVASYLVANDMDTLKTGILATDATDSVGNANRVLSLIEKPHPSETSSRLACPCFYYLSSPALPLVHQFVKDSVARGEGLEARDAAGKLIAWLVANYPVYAVGVTGRLDIGGLQSYIEAEEYLLSGTHE
ncbi:nucleotide-diphospho-sugar transferase [Obelidium mucronatum]|nr:nucleotide-diphospho-sugar transferase [Obelidium mucronatum]